MAMIKILLCILFIIFSFPVPAAYGGIDVGNSFVLLGDSHSDDQAADMGRELLAVAPVSIGSYTNIGLSASALIYGIGRYEDLTGKDSITWIHAQESGNQVDVSQNTATAFGDTFDDLIASIIANSGASMPVITYETAFSFGREAEAYRNWDPYNVELRARIDAWEALGTTIILVDTDANIKALQTEIGDPGEVWCQAAEGCAYHFKTLGNLQIALGIWAALGYTRDEVDLSDSEIQALDPAHVEAALDIAFGRSLFVSPTGSDSVAYADNDINNPWASPYQAWNEARSKDVVYYEAGTYTITTSINQPGSSIYDNVRHEAMPGAVVWWESDLDDPIYINNHFITVSHINVSWLAGADPGGVSDDAFFKGGWGNTGFSADDFTFEYGTGIKEKYNGNSGIFHSRPDTGDLPERWTIRYATLIGPGEGLGDDNSSLVIMFEAIDWLLLNCEMSGSRNGAYFNKHTNGIGTRGGRIENCYFHDNNVEIRTSTNGTEFVNNIIDGVVRMGYNPGPNPDGNVGSDDNYWERNTITGLVENQSHTTTGDNLPGSQYNDYQSNIVMGIFEIHRYSSEDPHYSGDYNLFSSTLYNNNDSHSLAEWQLLWGGCPGVDNDCNSLIGTPIFVGGVSPTTIEGFALASNSPGFGQNIGADVTLVGPGVSRNTAYKMGGGII